MGYSFRYLCAKKYQHSTWFDRVIEKIKRVKFASQGRLLNKLDFDFVASP